MAYDNVDEDADNGLEDEDEANGAPPPEESGNRAFIIVAGILGGIALLALLFIAAYALFIRPQQISKREGLAATANAQNTEVAFQVAQTSTAAAEAAAAAAITNTPTPKPELPKSTPTASPTAVIAVPTTAVPTIDPRTATVSALLTQASPNPYAINITVDQAAWGKRYAEWLAKTLNGKGNVVMVLGTPGDPATEARKKAAEDVFKQYPGIKILKEIYGMGDQNKAQTATAAVLATEPKIEGIFVEDSMALGVLRALQAANRQVTAMTGEATPAYLKLWKEQLAKQPTFQSFVQADPPGISASALKVALLSALGYKFNSPANNTYFYPVPKVIDNTTLDQAIQELAGKPDNYYLDEWLTNEQALALFEKAAAGTPVPAGGVTNGAPGKTVTIGLSNGSAASDWQTQSVNDIQQAFDEAKANGWISKDSQLKIVNAGGDVNQQIQQALGLINQKVDMLLVNAISAQALSSIIDNAKAASVPVVSYDQAASANAPLAQVPTATALPTTGFAEDAGVPMMLGLAVLLIVIIFLARRLRSA